MALECKEIWEEILRVARNRLLPCYCERTGVIRPLHHVADWVCLRSAVGFSFSVIQGRFPENRQGHRHHHSINFLHGTDQAADPEAEGHFCDVPNSSNATDTC